VRRLLPVVLCLVLCCAAAADAEEQVAQRGPVTADLSFSAHWQALEFSDMWLQIQRDGQLVYEGEPWVSACGNQTCWPGGGRDNDSVRLADLDADGDPEVLVNLYSGGAHCCFFARFYEFDGQRCHSFSHGFADAGDRLKDLDGDYAAELLSGDARFGYRYTSFASGWFPLQIWGYGGYESGLIDVTADYPARVRAGVAFLPEVPVRGPLRAAWAARRLGGGPLPARPTPQHAAKAAVARAPASAAGGTDPAGDVRLSAAPVRAQARP
jgi:hypothetical protein